jgi:hypothetical protein
MLCRESSLQLKPFLSFFEPGLSSTIFCVLLMSIEIPRKVLVEGLLLSVNCSTFKAVKLLEI